MQQQSVPTVTAADIARLVRRDFPPELHGEVNSRLATYESISVGKERVLAAILKLADGKIDDIENYVKAANADFRDVFAWAEYPRYMREVPAGREGLGQGSDYPVGLGAVSSVVRSMKGGFHTLSYHVLRPLAMTSAKGRCTRNPSSPPLLLPCVNSRP